MLHVVNGESLAESIRASGVLQPLPPFLREHRDPDEVVAWIDPLTEGPVRPGPSPINLAHERSQFIAAQGWEPYIIVRQDFGRRDAALAKAKRQDEVVFWFEDDLTDVLQLAQALDRLAARRPQATLFSWILRDRDAIDGGHGFGRLPAERVRQVLAGRQPVPGDAWAEARRFWTAFRSGDPSQLTAFRASVGPIIPSLRAGVERLLAEFPDRSSGLSRSETLVLDGLAQGGARTPASVLAHVQATEIRPFLGDVQVWDRLERFAAADPPVVERADGAAWLSSKVDLMSPDEPDLAAFRSQPLRLTDVGADLRAGRRDWLEHGGAGRWIGAYQITDAAGSWRFDPETTGLAEPANRLDAVTGG